LEPSWAGAQRVGRPESDRLPGMKRWPAPISSWR
jgi:hypothetical protein